MEIRLIVPHIDQGLTDMVVPSGVRGCKHALRHVRIDPVFVYGKAIADIAGGFTATQGTGGWLDESGKLVVEPVTVFDCSVQEDATINTVGEFTKLAGLIARELHQTCVYLRIDGKVEYVKP